MKIALRSWMIGDAPALARICHNVPRDYLRNRLPYPYTEENAVWWLNNVAFSQEGKTGLFRAVTADGACVGSLSVEQKDDVYCRDAALGYLLLPAHWGRGIMTEAVRLACREAFATLDIARISAEVYAQNAASRRVLEKNGFVLEGARRRAVWKNGAYHDECLYGLLK